MRSAQTVELVSNLASQEPQLIMPVAVAGISIANLHLPKEAVAEAVRVEFLALVRVPQQPVQPILAAVAEAVMTFMVALPMAALAL